MLAGCFSTLIWNATLKASTGINGIIIGGIICAVCIFVFSAAFKGEEAEK